MPYAFVDFLDDRLSTDLRVFEYGCGNSTKWFANRVDEVVAVEHNKEWVEKIRPETAENTEIQYVKEEDYPSAISEYGDFDLILIDGIRRRDCEPIALEKLTDRGVVIYDDTFGTKSPRRGKHLLKNDYREIYFQGMGPVTANIQRTSVFYKEENNLNI
jgi:predicted O-methyltransferase YrrM